MVPGGGEIEDGVRRDEAESMARGHSRWRPGAAAGGDRSCDGERQAPVENGNVNSLQGKIVDDVREVRDDAGSRMEGDSGSGAHLCHRKSRWTAADRAFSDE